MPQDLKDYFPDPDTIVRQSNRGTAELRHHRAKERPAPAESERRPTAARADRPARGFWTTPRISIFAGLSVVLPVMFVLLLVGRDRRGGAAPSGLPAGPETAAMVAAASAPGVGATSATAATSTADELDASAPGAASTTAATASATSAAPTGSNTRPAPKPTPPNASSATPSATSAASSLAVSATAPAPPPPPYEDP